MSTTERHPGTTSRRRRRHSSRHDEAVIRAEARRLARALAPYGLLPQRDAPERAAEARRRHEGSFDAVLDAAARARAIGALPYGVYGRSSPAD